jgi:hypothetical protein
MFDKEYRSSIGYQRQNLTATAVILLDDLIDVRPENKTCDRRLKHDQHHWLIYTVL